MAVQSEFINNIPVITVDNEEDLIRGTDYYNTINNFINNDGITKFVINITELKNLNSSGIGVIVKTALRLEELGGKIAVASISPRIKQLFTLANITDIVQIFEVTQQAVDYVANWNSKKN